MYNTNNIQLILKWYDLNKRDLPWRNANDPYKTWLSEIMLQQTQVQTVIPYFNKWMKQFPTLSSVANANLDQVLKSWEGLGYYRRCKNFHQAAKIVIKDYNGMIPNDYETLKKLPGLGEYSASAIMSIAFNEKYPAIDSNLVRVISRILGIKKLSNYNKKKIYQFANQLVQCQRPGDINQALMDIGSTLCTSRKTECLTCPVNNNCKAFKAGNPVLYPNKINKKPQKTVYLIGCYIKQNGKFAIRNRKEKSLLGDLWEFPTIEKKSKTISNLKIINSYFGNKIDMKQKIGTAKHTYSHFKCEVDLYLCTINDTNGEIKDMRWIKKSEFSKYAFSKLNHKLFSLIFKSNV